MEIVIWLIVGLVAGAAIGAVSVWWFNRSRGGRAGIAAIRRENEQFRNEVSEHFVETARLINQMTDSYKAVFDHLSKGADKLVDDKILAERMPRVSSQEVRLRHMGKTEAAGSGGESSVPAKSDSKKSASPESDAGGKGSDSEKQGVSDSAKNDKDDSGKKPASVENGGHEANDSTEMDPLKDKSPQS